MIHKVYINNRCKIVIVYLSCCLGVWQTERKRCKIVQKSKFFY